MPKSPSSYRLLVTTAILFALLFGLVLGVQWHTGRDAHLGLASYIPVSDALGYYRCAVAAMGFGDGPLPGVSPEWCARRGIYPAMLGTMLAVSSWHPAAVLLLQMLILAIAAAFAVVATYRSLGAMTSITVGGGAALFIIELALGNFMTEFAGTSFGLLSMALLVGGARRGSTATVAAGVAGLSIALASRAGAMFALPLVALWFLGYAWQVRRLNAIVLTILAGALAAGPLVHVVSTAAFGTDLSNTGGNFSTTLYGLSTGSRDWSQAYRDFEQVFRTTSEKEAFAIVWQRSLENIQASPQLIYKALAEAFFSFTNLPFAFSQHLVAQPVSDVLRTLALLGALWCVINWRKPHLTILLAVSVGELLSVPFIIDSGGHRVLAATFWVRPALVGVGMAALLLLLLRIWKVPQRAQSAPEEESGTAIAAIAVLALISCFAFIPALPVPKSLPILALAEPPPPCPPQTKLLLTDLRKGAFAVRAADEPHFPLDRVLVVQPSALDRYNPGGPWWAEGWGRFSKDEWLIYAFEMSAVARGEFYVFSWIGELPLHNNKVLAFCLQDADQTRKIGDYSIRRAVNVHQPRLLGLN